MPNPTKTNSEQGGEMKDLLKAINIMAKYTDEKYSKWEKECEQFLSEQIDRANFYKNK